MLTTETMQIRKGASQAKDPAQAAEELYRLIHQEEISLAVFFCSPEYDLEKLGAELKQRFGGVHLIGCTTAGEITPLGYLDGSLTGVSIASRDFTVATRRIDRLAEFELGHSNHIVAELLDELRTKDLDVSLESSFGFLLIDGLSCQEEMVIAGLYRALGDMPLFGGSAGDGVRFDRTYLYHDGEFRTDCALISIVHTTSPFLVFKTEHFVDSDKKMVITQADPARRIVTEINGEPAGPEYARMVGLEVAELTPMIFATYPVVVRIGGDLYVRSIQKVNEDGSLTFFCAIDEGIVLTVAQGVDILENLRGLLNRISETVGPPQLILGCDCILRKLELDQRGLRSEVGRLLVEHNMIGFGTYGEQFHGMHVNQTLTGVAIGHRRP
jgi:hypothetical protein